MPGKADKSAEWLHPPAEEEGLRRYVETIRERIWLVVIAVLITTGASVLYVLTAPKTYEASADMLVTPVSSEDPTLTALPLIRESVDPTRDVETAALLVRNVDVAERVQEGLATTDSPEELLDKITAEPIAQSNFVSVTATEDSPESAAELANAFATATVADRTDQLHLAVEQQLEALGPGTPSATVTQLETLSNASTPDIRVETEAQPPSGAATPKTKLSIAAGLVAGLLLGVAGAFASQILDPRLRREAQLRRLYSLPVLARIPDEGGGGRRSGKPLSPRALSSAGAEAYRTLRSTLTSEVDGRGSSVILVTGPSPGEGKSTTAINLASSLALSGKKVILIEADLRRPSLGRTMDVKPEGGGVVSVLIENRDLEDALIPSPTYGNNLRLLVADYEGGWITELFSIPAAQKMVDDARRLADYVIIDSPPLNEVVDSLPLARRADEVLIVVRVGKTRLAKIAQLGELLAENGITPVGFAVVGTPRPSRNEYHYYGASRKSDSERGLFSPTRG